MSADPVDPVELDALARNAALTRPRPGHADLVGMQKYGFDEARPILERASARETAARVALGPGGHRLPRAGRRRPDGLPRGASSAASPHRPASVPTADDVACLDDDPVRCLDPDASKQMVERIDQAHKDGDTLGGVVEVVVHGLPPGLGSHVHWDRRLDSRLAGALMGIQAIKGVEVGDGFELAATPGSLAHDEIVRPTRASARTSGRSGGTEGGMSTGEVLRVRAAMKPIATVPRALRTVDVATGEEAVAHHQRSDVCAVPAAGIVAEAMVALVLADAVLEKFGGDSVHRDPAQRRELPGHPEVHGDPTVRAWSSSSARWAPARRTVGRRCSPTAWGVDCPGHRPRRRGARGSRRSPTSSSTPARRTSASWSAAAVADALAEHDGVLALGGGAVLDAATRELLAGHRVVFLRVGLADAVKRVGLGASRPLLLGNVRAGSRRCSTSARPIYEAVADRDGRHRRAHARGGRRRDPPPGVGAMTDDA